MTNIKLDFRLKKKLSKIIWNIMITINETEI